MAKNYKQIKLLGEGAFGKCYLCENTSDRSRWVVKQIDISKMSPQEKKEAYCEAKIMSAFDHPNIIRFHDIYTTTNGKLNIVMDYADGGDLQSKIKQQRGRLFQEREIIDIFVQITLAVKHVHDRKVLHRDLKGQNIFLTRTGMIKLGDFGIARVLSHTVEKARTMVGTPYYLSPEIIENRPYNFKSDVWSLGVILYELCTLKPPFDGSSLQNLALKIVRGSYPPIAPHFSRDIKNLISQMLSVDPNRRPTVAQILKQPFITNRIQNVLSESIRKAEFSHTILHKQKLFDPKAPIREKDIKPKEEVKKEEVKVPVREQPRAAKPAPPSKPPSRDLPVRDNKPPPAREPPQNMAIPAYKPPPAREPPQNMAIPAYKPPPAREPPQNMAIPAYKPQAAREPPQNMAIPPYKPPASRESPQNMPNPPSKAPASRDPYQNMVIPPYKPPPSREPPQNIPNPPSKAPASREPPQNMVIPPYRPPQSRESPGRMGNPASKAPASREPPQNMAIPPYKPPASRESPKAGNQRPNFYIDLARDGGKEVDLAMYEPVPKVVKNKPVPAEFRGGLEDVFKPVAKDQGKRGEAANNLNKQKAAKEKILKEQKEREEAKKAEYEKLREERNKKRDDERKNMKNEINDLRNKAKRGDIEVEWGGVKDDNSSQPSSAPSVEEGDKRKKLREELNKKRGQKEKNKFNLECLADIDQLKNIQIDKDYVPKRNASEPVQHEVPVLEAKPRSEIEPLEEEPKQNIIEESKEIDSIPEEPSKPVPGKKADKKKLREEGLKKMRKDKMKKKKKNDFHIEWIGGIADFADENGEIVFNKEEERLFKELEEVINEDPEQENEVVSEELIQEQVPVIEDIVDREDELENQEILPMDICEPFIPISLDGSSNFSSIELYRHYLEDQIGIDCLIKVYQTLKDCEARDENKIDYEEVYQLLQDIVPEENKVCIQWVHTLIFLEHRADRLYDE